MVDRIVKEIDESLEKGLFLGALALSLTLPDICGKAEYQIDNNGNRYRDWFDNYVIGAQIAAGFYNDGMAYLSGEVVYQLRCNFLHQGNPNTDNKKCNIERFRLIINEDNWSIHGTLSGAELDSQGQIVSRSLYVDVGHLCTIIKNSALKYYNTNREKFNFFNYELVDNREHNRILRELQARNDQ